MDLLDDPRFATDELRGKNGHMLSEIMQRWCASRCADEALDELARANIPAGPILAPRQVISHPQVTAMEIFKSVAVPGVDRAVPLTMPPVSLSATPAVLRYPPPKVGEHNQEILA